MAKRQLLYVKDLAKRLMISRQAVHALVNRYEIEWRNKGRLKYLREADLRLLLRRQGGNRAARGQVKNRDRV